MPLAPSNLPEPPTTVAGASGKTVVVPSGGAWVGSPISSGPRILSSPRALGLLPPVATDADLWLAEWGCAIGEGREASGMGPPNSAYTGPNALRAALVKVS